MRTNIDIDDALIAEAMAVLGLPTKKAAVEAALSRVVRHAKQRRAFKELIGAGWEGDLDAIREGRDFDLTK
jgi:Arc/MetJ family transcription regulator